MTFTLKPKFFLLGFLPGFLFMIGFIVLKKECDFHAINEFAKTITVFSGIAIIILSFIIGQVFDSFRDWFLEGFLFNKKFKRWKIDTKPTNETVNWDFYYNKTESEIDKLDGSFYIFYAININISISLMVLLAMVLTNFPNKIPDTFFIQKHWIAAILIICIIILYLDACLIRRSIVRLTRQ